jgi:transcriptional regulator of arginine metabolism
MTKSFRQGQILQLIRSQAIFTQDELARKLRESGLEATQVTLSRDIRELGLVKTVDGYRELLPREASNVHLASLAGEFLRDVRSAMNQVVLRTASGHASSVAVALDGERWPEVLGTIAGDDTILVICPDPATAQTVASRLLQMLAEA